LKDDDEMEGLAGILVAEPSDGEGDGGEYDDAESLCRAVKEKDYPGVMSAMRAIVSKITEEMGEGEPSEE
jgi:hypothetical protein